MHFVVGRDIKSTFLYAVVSVTPPMMTDDDDNRLFMRSINKNCLLYTSDAADE